MVLLVLPWLMACDVTRVEKYRPTRLDDVVGNRATIERLKVIQEDGNCPHLLISVRVREDGNIHRPPDQLFSLQGLPGIGKTTSVHCLAHALLGGAYKEGVLELNASDDR